MFESVESQRRIGRFAWVMAWVGLVVGQLHALSRFATEDGKEDLEIYLTAWWAEPAADRFRPLLDWADPDIVYITYGKIWLPVFLAFTLCAFVVRRRREPVGFEKWAWRLALTGYVVACAGVFLDYWTQWTGDYNGDGIEALLFAAGWMTSLPGLALTMLGSTVLGLTLLAKRFRPAGCAVLLAAAFPLALGVLEFTSLGSAALPIMFAFGILGRRIAREHTAYAVAPDDLLVESRVPPR